MNHTPLPKEVLLPDWARRKMQATKGDRVKSGTTFCLEFSFLKFCGGDWMERAQDRDMWPALVGKVTKFRVP
jgi:hypothetical protein